jgi:hypothetical protein
VSDLVVGAANQRYREGLKDLVSHDRPDLVGQEIEVIVRYRGQEWVAGSGIVRFVNVESEIAEVPITFDETHRRFIQTGVQTISIQVDRAL